MGTSFLEDRRLEGVSGFEMKKQSEKHPPTHHPADYLENQNGPGKKSPNLSFERERDIFFFLKILKKP